MPRRVAAVSVDELRCRNRTSGGYIRFDRDLRRIGVGRLQISSGTDKPHEFDRRNGIISRLVEDGKLDVLRALKDGQLSIQELVDAHRRHRLDTVLEDSRWARRNSISDAPATNPGSVVPDASRAAAPIAAADLQLATKLGLMLLGRLAGSGTGEPDAEVRSLLERCGMLPAEAPRRQGADLGPSGGRSGALDTASPVTLGTASAAAGPHLISIPGVDTPFREEQEPLWSTLLDRVVPALHSSPETRRRYETSLEALRRKMRRYTLDKELAQVRPYGSDDAQPLRYDELAVEVFHQVAANGSVGDLRRINPWFWRSLQGQWGASPADWNHMRRGLGAALTGLFAGNARHPFRQAIIGAIPTEDEGEGRTPDLSVEKFWEIVDHMPEHVQPAPVVLVATGMRLKEYLSTLPQHLKPTIFAVDISGTKTAAKGGVGSKGTMLVAPELWPWVEAGIPSPHQAGRLRQHWIAACKKAGVVDVHLHDLRHCLGQWATDAGVPEKAVQWALRHRDPNMTRRYTRTRGKREVATAMGTILHRD